MQSFAKANEYHALSQKAYIRNTLGNLCYQYGHETTNEGGAIWHEAYRAIIKEPALAETKNLSAMRREETDGREAKEASI